MPAGKDQGGIVFAEAALSCRGPCGGLFPRRPVESGEFRILAQDPLQGFRGDERLERRWRERDSAQRPGIGRIGAMNGAEQRREVRQFVERLAQIAQPFRELIERQGAGIGMQRRGGRGERADRIEGVRLVDRDPARVSRPDEDGREAWRPAALSPR
ncbi:MAG: hypothetical protein WDN69_22775 [Aliidongia sp.]